MEHMQPAGLRMAGLPRPADCTSGVAERICSWDTAQRARRSCPAHDGQPRSARRLLHRSPPRLTPPNGMLGQSCASRALMPSGGRAPLPPRPVRRPAAAAVRCSQQPGGAQPVQEPSQHDRQASLVALARMGMLVAVSSAVAACQAPAAHAQGWQPRRHSSRTLREHFVTHETPKQAAARKAAEKRAAAAAAAERAAAAEAQMSDAQRWLRNAQRRVQDVWERQMYTVGAPVNRAEVARIHDRSSSGAPTASGFWWLPLAAVAGGVALWQLVKLVGRGGRRSSGGRWVRDRSLGGKMVFIPDAELPVGSNGGKTMRPLYEDPDDGVAAAAAAAEAEAAGTGVWAAPSSSQAAAGAAAAEELPGWWEEPRFLVYTTFTRKEELQRQARLVLRELQDAKLQGMDYPISSLVGLRTLCQEAGGYQVKPSTESGRDAMLRHAVRAAIAAGQTGSFSLLGGDPPAKFVCGLAHDLGVPDKRAVEIVHGQVAAECREALVSAEAAYRSGNQPDLLLALYRLAGALGSFPLPRGSAQGEMVGRQVAQTMDLALRKQIFLEFGAISPPLAALVAELLGFDPALVMAELARLQAAEEAEQQEQQPAAGDEGSS